MRSRLSWRTSRSRSRDSFASSATLSSIASRSVCQAAFRTFLSGSVSASVSDYRDSPDDATQQQYDEVIAGAGRIRHTRV
jgi:hypothetical protein